MGARHAGPSLSLLGWPQQILSPAKLHRLWPELLHRSGRQPATCLKQAKFRRMLPATHLVIQAPLLLILQHLIGLVDLLKLL